jgi:hypothetical protein
MRAISQNCIDKFLKQADLAARAGNLIRFIIEGYKFDTDHFHDVFLQSRFMLKMSDTEIEATFEKLREFLRQEVGRDLVCMNWLRYFIVCYDEEIKRLIREGNISAEDLLYYYETLVVKYKAEGNFFDEVPPHIAASQFEFYEGAFGCLIEIINRHSIPFRDATPKENAGLKQIMALILLKESATEIFDSIAYKSYKVNYGNNCWLMEYTCDYWPEFELYRDLNISYFYNQDTTLWDSVNLFEKSGFLTKKSNNEVFRFDFAKAESYFAELGSFKTSQMLGFLYGDANTEFEYEGDTFKVWELLEIAKALTEYAGKKENLYSEAKHPAMFKIVGSRQLLRMIGLQPTSGRKKLLNLFCFDFEKNRGHQAGNKLLFGRKNLFYLIYSRIQAPTLIKVIDKILANEVVVRYPEKKSRGIYFEECLEKFFRDNAIPFWHIPRKAGKMIPEIDGMFLIDNVVFIYEAKASIKPESLVEAFNFLKDSLLKAQDQIRERIDILENDNVKRQFIEEQTGLSFEGKTIQPLIICNHMFFSGYKELLVDESRHIPIIDFILLKKVITDKKAPIWELDKQTGRYRKKELEVVTGEDLRSYFLNQILIQGDIKIQRQPTQYGVIFPICPSALIDYDSLNINQ